MINVVVLIVINLVKIQCSIEKVCGDECCPLVRQLVIMWSWSEAVLVVVEWWEEVVWSVLWVGENSLEQ